MLKLIIAGPLGADAEVRHIDNGQAAISFSVAHAEKWKNARGEQQERTTWVKCTIWRKADQTSVAQYLLKGTKVIVEGTPSARAWNGTDGTAKASLELNVKDLEFMGSANRQTATAPAQQTTRTPAPAPAPTQSNADAFASNPVDDDLPF